MVHASCPLSAKNAQQGRVTQSRATRKMPKSNEEKTKPQQKKMAPKTAENHRRTPNPNQKAPLVTEKNTDKHRKALGNARLYPSTGGNSSSGAAVELSVVINSKVFRG